MPIKNKLLADAEPHEIRAFATNFLNLDMTGSENDAEVLAMVERAQPGISLIFVEEKEEAEGPLTGTYDIIQQDDGRLTGSLGRGDPRVVINIPFGSEDTIGRADVGVGVNGVVWQLRRGQNIKVPWRVVEALGLTEQDVIRHDMEKDEVIITKAMRFPIQFPEGMPSRETIAEWRERTDDSFCP